MIEPPYFLTLAYQVSDFFSSVALILNYYFVLACSWIRGWPGTPWVCGGGLVVALLRFLYKAHRQWKNGWLSTEAAARLKEIKRSKPTNPLPLLLSWQGRPRASWLLILEFIDNLINIHVGTFYRDVRRPYFPTLVSFFLIFAVVALFFAFPHFSSLKIIEVPKASAWLPDISKDLGEKQATAVAGVFSGLAVVIIALIVFVAESIRDDNDYERKRSLLRTSWLWPLGLTATLMPFGILWSPTSVMTVALEIIMGLLTIYAFARVLRVLLDPTARASNKMALLRQNIGKAVSDALAVRVFNNILLGSLGKGNRIDTIAYGLSRSFLDNGAQAYLFLDAPRPGWLKDVQLDELQQLGNYLDDVAVKQLDFTLREVGKGAVPTSRTGQISNESKTPKAQKKLYLMKRVGEALPADEVFRGNQRTILALPVEFQKIPGALERVRTTLPHIFKITAEEPTSYVVRRELQATKDQLIRGIKESALGSIDELRQTYLSIAEEFLTKLVEHGGGYSYKQAKEENSLFADGWSEVQWLEQDLREFIDVAASTDNTTVAGSIFYLPFAVAVRAIQVRDHYLFQQFFRFVTRIYSLSRQASTSEPVRNMLRHRSWRWPQEIIQYYVVPELSSPTASVEDIDNFYDFARFGQLTFQELMKLQADERDVEGFQTVVSDFTKLFRRLREDMGNASIGLLKLQAERTTDAEQLKALNESIERESRRNEAIKNLQRNTGMVLLALGGRLLSQHLEQPGDAARLRLLGIVRQQLPHSLSELTSVYVAASDWRAGDEWGWAHWDIRADGEVHTVDDFTNLNRIYTLSALDIIGKMLPDQRKTLHLPVSRVLAEKSKDENERGLRPMLDEFEQQRDQYVPLLGGDYTGGILIMRELLQGVQQKEQIEREQQTRQAVLDQALVAEFREDVLKSFHEAGRLRAVLSELDIVKTVPADNEEPDERVLGIRQIDDKQVFIIQDYTSFVGWGRSYGESMARGEDETVFEKIINGTTQKDNVGPGRLVETILAKVDALRFKNPIILQSLDFEVEYAELNTHPRFSPRYDPKVESKWQKFNAFFGNLEHGQQKIPIFDIPERNDQRNVVIIMDPEHFMRWEQYALVPENGGISQEPLVDVIDLSHDNDERNRIMEQKPQWLLEKDDPEAYLRTHVVVHVREKFDVKIMDGTAAICLLFKTGEESD